MRPSEALQVALHVLRGGNSPFFIGSVGVGKSYVAYGLCNILANGLEVVRDEINPSDSQYGFIDIRLSLLESIDLGGLPFLGKTTSRNVPFSATCRLEAKGFYCLMNTAKRTPVCKQYVDNCSMKEESESTFSLLDGK